MGIVRLGMRVGWPVAVLLIATLIGCEDAEEDPAYVARVKDQHLTQADVDEALGSMPARLDTADARRQIVEQWVTNALLFEEASRRGLRSDREVQRLLDESERSVMVSALLSRIYDEEDVEPTDQEVQIYFERNMDLFRIREPFVRVRHLTAASADSASNARREMQGLADAPNADSLWPGVVERYGIDTDAALDLASSHIPQSRLFTTHRELHEALSALRDGEVSAVIQTDGRYHVLQLVERVPIGAVPELSWVESDLRRRLIIQSRKQIYTRHVQRLRNEALAREDLVVR